MAKKEQKQVLYARDALLFLLFGIIILSFRHFGSFRSLVVGLFLLYISLRTYSSNRHFISLAAVIVSILVLLKVVPFIIGIINFIFLMAGIVLLAGSLIRFIQHLLTDSKRQK